MYVRIRVADRQDANMVRDMVTHFGGKDARIVFAKKSSWWYAYANATKSELDQLINWAAKNETKIFAIETSGEETYYEADS